MPPHLVIRYYRVINDGYGTVIYPALHAPRHGDEIFWSGQGIAEQQYMTVVGQDVIVDLLKEKIPPHTPFFLSHVTVFGKPQYTTEQSFVLDVNSNDIATCRRRGPVEHGHFDFIGIKPFHGEDTAALKPLSSGTLQANAVAFEVRGRPSASNQE